MKLKGFGAMVLGIALLIPMLVFSADVTINLKDKQGADFSDLSGVTVRVLDGVGSIVQEVNPTSASVNFANLVSQESYTVLVKYHKVQAVEQNADVTIDTASSKSVRFDSDTEVLSKDFFIQDAVASNVLMRVTGVPSDWTEVKIRLIPVESSKSQIDKSELIFAITPINGTAELTVPAVPAMGYSWIAGNQDDSQTLTGDNTKRARNNATLAFNLNTLKTPTITTTFHLRNIDRTEATFNGETIHLEIKDANNNVVYTKDMVATGTEVTDTTGTLSQGSYTIYASLSNGGALKRETTRTANLYSNPRTSIINFVKLDTVNIDFLVRDSRTGVNLTDGLLKINDKDGNLLEEVPLTGSVITRPLIHGYQYKIEAAATGYSTRTSNLYPRENVVREISLFKL